MVLALNLAPSFAIGSLAGTLTPTAVSTGDDLRQYLFELSLATDFTPHRNTLNAIQETLQAAGRTAGRLKYLPQLSGSDPAAIAQALSEITYNDAALQVLVASGAFQATVDIAALPDIAAAAHTLSTLTSRAPLPGEALASSVATDGSDGRYWRRTAAALTGAPLSIVLSSLSLATGGVLSPVLLIGAGLALATGALPYQQWRRLALEMIEAAKSGPIGPNQTAAFFRAFKTPGGVHESLFSLRPSTEDVITAIHESRGPAGIPTPSHDDAWRVVRNFANVGTVASWSLQVDPSGKLYDRLAAAVGLGILQQLNWQPTVLHPERFEELRALQEEGYTVIFISNHRSHFDILVTVALLRDFSPRIVAKKELSLAPVLGWTPFHRPWNIVNPGNWRIGHLTLGGKRVFLPYPGFLHDDGLLGGAGHLLVDRADSTEAIQVMNENARRVVGEGHALYAYAEGTRSPTRDRRYEFGMRPFKDGIFHVAESLGEKVVIVPLAYYGNGRLLPKDLGQDFKEGPMRNQPVVLMPGQPIFVDQERARSGLTGKTLAKHLNLTTWHALWTMLGPLQELMNEEPDRALAV